MQTIKAGDTAVVFNSTLEKVDDDEVWTLTDATVDFYVKRGSTVYGPFSATVISESARTVKYQVATGFPTTPGTYSQEWRVVFSDGSELTFPNEDYNKFTIKARLSGESGVIGTGIGTWVIGSTFIVG